TIAQCRRTTHTLCQRNAATIDPEKYTQAKRKRTFTDTPTLFRNRPKAHIDFSEGIARHNFICIANESLP
ncbi:hypothetical protein, partial [Edwardsiella tarda]|uniref:hypothetical protein n=1 Tax=Edwardsiella tarda TaxID=636 RepID=UPI0019673F51